MFGKIKFLISYHNESDETILFYILASTLSKMGYDVSLGYTDPCDYTVYKSVSVKSTHLKDSEELFEWLGESEVIFLPHNVYVDSRPFIMNKILVYKFYPYDEIFSIHKRENQPKRVTGNFCASAYASSQLSIKYGYRMIHLPVYPGMPIIKKGKYFESSDDEVKAIFPLFGSSIYRTMRAVSGYFSKLLSDCHNLKLTVVHSPMLGMSPEPHFMLKMKKDAARRINFVSINEWRSLYMTMSAHDICILPQFVDSYGLLPSLSMVSGAIPICFDIPVTCDVVDDSNSGILVKHDGLIEISKKLVYDDVKGTRKKGSAERYICSGHSRSSSDDVHDDNNDIVMKFDTDSGLRVFFSYVKSIIDSPHRLNNMYDKLYENSIMLRDIFNVRLKKQLEVDLERIYEDSKNV